MVRAAIKSLKMFEASTTPGTAFAISWRASARLGRKLHTEVLVTG